MQARHKLELPSYQLHGHRLALPSCTLEPAKIFEADPTRDDSAVMHYDGIEIDHRVIFLSFGLRKLLKAQVL
jgi:hypothetical protein